MLSYIYLCTQYIHGKKNYYIHAFTQNVLIALIFLRTVFAVHYHLSPMGKNMVLSHELLENLFIGDLGATLSR
ncbi:hypothetical protein VNO77_34056 [Canavalia gladiata]|uniref:Uncharacterized protein n=1 Tax=Canavalia gladiata TaxID=3824 RepID=A0AAN9KFK4_CANGL